MNSTKINFNKIIKLAVGVILILNTLMPLCSSNYILPSQGGGMVHCDPQMTENIWLPGPTSNESEVWYSRGFGGEIFGTQGNGIAGNGKIAACSFNNILSVLQNRFPNITIGYNNLILYDYYGNRLWSDDHFLNGAAATSSPMIDIDNRVIACDNKTIIMVNASDLNNIHVQWNQSFNLGSFYRPFATSPLSPSIMDDRIVILPTNNGPVLAYDAETGKLMGQIYLGENVTINPYWGVPEMSWSDYLTVVKEYVIDSICPYRYNQSSQKIEWNSTVPYGIMPKKQNTFFDNGLTYKFESYDDQYVTVSQWDGQTHHYVEFANNSMDPGVIYTGTGFFSTINSVCIEGDTVYIATQYKKPNTRSVNRTVGRLYAIQVDAAENDTVNFTELWNFTYFGVSQASPTLINDTLYFDGYNNSKFDPEKRDPHIYAVYANNGTLRWARESDNNTLFGITLFTFTKDPRGGFWYEDCNQLSLTRNTGGNKLIRFSEENGSILEEINMKNLIGEENGSLSVLPSSDMTICGTPTNPIMLISANHPHFNEGKWVVAINLTDNNTVIFQRPINSTLGWNYPDGDYTILNESGEYRILFGTNVGGVMAIGRQPNCSFNNINFEPWESINKWNDSINASYSVGTAVRQDKIHVKAMLISLDHPVLGRYTLEKNLTINASGIQDDLSITLPPYAPAGLYNLTVYLYNSSGYFWRKTK